MTTFKTSHGEITVNHESWDGNPIITITGYDDSGTRETEVSLHLDNHQAYKLAMTILSGLDVVDTRGNH